MIRAASRTGQFVQRLHARAGRLVKERVDTLRKGRRQSRQDWHSAAALWPDLFGDPRDGK
jgi:hypothetical protein